MATPMPGRGQPSYPAIMMSAGVDGDVRVRYVVDAAGHTVPSSFVVVYSTHQLFTASVRRVFPDWQFTPAQLHGRRVGVRYEEIFSFRGALDAYDRADFKAPQVSDNPKLSPIAEDSVLGTVPRTTLPWGPKDFESAARLSTSDVLAAQRNALEVIATREKADTAQSAQRARLEKPFGVTVQKAEAWSGNQVRIWAHVSQGNITDYFVCIVNREQRRWIATCPLFSRSQRVF